MAKEQKAVTLKLTSAIPLDGEICKAGEFIEVDELLAKNLLHRGKAVLATEHDGVFTAQGSAEKTNLSKLTLEQLRAEAVERKIEGADKMAKAALIAAIEQVDGQAAPQA